MSNSFLSHSLSKLMLWKFPFVAFRRPHDKDVHILSHCQTSFFYNMEALNDAQGFVIVPFFFSKTSPGILLQSYRKYIHPAPAHIQTTSAHNYIPSSAEEKHAYLSAFNLFKEAVSIGHFQKLVLARKAIGRVTADFSPVKAFITACQQSQDTYVYLFHTQQTGTWIGSTPELFLQSEGDGFWNTMALAGTRSMKQNVPSEEWDEKNIREQSLVVEYIKEKILSVADSVTETERSEVAAGRVQHLMTGLRFHKFNFPDIGNFIASLHPTPAVCGLPKHNAMDFILANELPDRRYYAGFLGELDPKRRTDLYVNLRCMVINSSNSCKLYAGSGILPTSDFETEWKETENKLQSMRSILS
jgi:isochorismate synthase